MLIVSPDPNRNQYISMLFGPIFEQMYLAKSITSRSLPEIGRKFGGRDHTTVMHAVKKIEELKHADNNFNEDIELLKRLIDS